jgi:SAM-dependent methyltransferase
MPTPPGDAARPFENKTCTAPAARSERMRDIVLEHVPRVRAVRVLDIGCGTGSLVFCLADALPAATLVGIDISAANIRAAREQLGARSSGRTSGTPQSTSERPETAITFDAVDYFEYRSEPFDLVVTDGVLHLIPGATAPLLEKLATDVRPGGLLVCNMPFDCRYNRVFSRIRSVIRPLRSTWLDRLILEAARVIHRGDMRDEDLRERVPYMYMPPERMMNDDLASCFAAAGFDRVAEYRMKTTSISQLKHRVTIFGRRAH